MLIVVGKRGRVRTGVYRSHHGAGILDFATSIIKRVGNSGLAKKAVRAINSKVGRKFLKTVKTVAQSDLGQQIQKKVASEIGRKAQEVIEDKIGDPLGRVLGSEKASDLLSGVGRRAESATESAFRKLGIQPPTTPPVSRKRPSSGGKGRKRGGKRARKSKGSGFITDNDSWLHSGYMPFLHEGRGIVLEE